MMTDGDRRSDRRKLDLGEVRRLYVEQGWSQNRIASHFGVAKYTIGQRLKRLGISPPSPTIDAETVRSLYVDEKWSPTRIAKHLKVSTAGVRYRLISMGVLIVRRRPRPDVGLIKKLYVDDGWSCLRIDKHLGVSNWTVEDRLKREGVRLRTASVLDDETKRDAVIDQIKDLYLNKRLTLQETAYAVHVSRNTVSKLLRSEGITVPFRPVYDIKEILHLYVDLGWTAERIAERFGCKTKLIFRHIFKAGVTRRDLRPALDPEKIRALYVEERYTVNKMAELFQVGTKTIKKIFEAEGIEKPGRGRRPRFSRHYDPRIANLDVGEYFEVQCMDVSSVQGYFLKLARQIGIRISTQKAGETALRITRYA